MKKTALLTLFVLAMTGIAAADRSVSESRALAADGRVEISNISGEVKVVGRPGDTVDITGVLESGVEELEIVSSGSRLRIEVDLEHRVRSGGSAYLTIEMPMTADLEVETVSADIEVDGVSGDISLESVSGKVEVSGQPRSLEAASVSGDVLVAASGGRSELETVSGNIVVRNAIGRLDTNVVSGNIEIEDGVLESLTGETVSGSIFCAARPADSGRFSLETMSGRIELLLPSDIDADFQIETYSGSINNSIGPEPVRTDDYGPGKELKFRSGSGRARISIESFSGSVKIRTE
jgi:DUF4097 and DUF4098 domain-containing protein YvlB